MNEEELKQAIVMVIDILRELSLEYEIDSNLITSWKNLTIQENKLKSLKEKNILINKNLYNITNRINEYIHAKKEFKNKKIELENSIRDLDTKTKNCDENKKQLTLKLKELKLKEKASNKTNKQYEKYQKEAEKNLNKLYDELFALQSIINKTSENNSQVQHSSSILRNILIDYMQNSDLISIFVDMLDESQKIQNKYYQLALKEEFIDQTILYPGINLYNCELSNNTITKFNQLKLTKILSSHESLFEANKKISQLNDLDHTLQKQVIADVELLLKRSYTNNQERALNKTVHIILEINDELYNKYHSMLKRIKESKG